MTIEERNLGSTRVDDCLAMETRKAWSHLTNPHVSTISIWGWDGIGKSLIANRIMEEAKKKEKADFDVVILVSVPRPVMPVSDIHLQPYPQNNGPNKLVTYFQHLQSITVPTSSTHGSSISRSEERERELEMIRYLEMVMMLRRDEIDGKLSDRYAPMYARKRNLEQELQMEKKRERELEALAEEWKRKLQESQRFTEERERESQEQRRRELQAKIVAELKLNVGTLSSSNAIANLLSNWLARRRFLIILKDVREQPYLKEIGVPLNAPDNSSKVILIPMSEVTHRQMRAEVFLQQNFRSLSEDQAWKLLDAEARDAATSLSLSYPNLITSDNILECFSYVSLFYHSTSIDATSLKEFWRLEGFLEDMRKRLQAEEEQEEVVEEWMEMTADALLAQLLERCMLISFQGEFQMPVGVWELVSSRKRFLIQCDSSSQVPQSNQWEAAERISLSHNQIQELPTKQLDIHSSPNCQRLLTLFLNDNKSLRSISDDFFKSMTSLQVLNLSATGIKFLPSSVSCLFHLKMLKLRNCSNLEALPPFLKDLPKLEVLDVKQTFLPSMVEASFEGMSSLRILDISNGAAKNLTRLSVKDCRSLSRLVGLQGLSKLTTLDLSRTKIKWLPHQVFNRPSLKQLHLMGMEHLKMIEWNYIERFPEELNWHRQSKEPPLQEQPQGSNGRFSISVSHDSIFHSLDQTSKLSNSSLQKFYFLICSCERGPKYRHAYFRRNRFCYSHVCNEHDSSAKNQRLVKYNRWLEVCGVKTFLNNLQGVLSMTDFYCLRGNEFIKTVFNEGMQLDNLKECWIEKCDQLDSVFNGNFGSGSFSCLKHLYLQCCPKLLNIFSSNIQLKQLEQLEIKFCGRLENVHPDENVAGQDAFPELAELHLWELGKLKKICGGYLPKLKKLKIGGCPLLKQLPLNYDDSSAAAYVQICGEAAWWKGIVWKGGVMPKNVRFRDHCSFKG